MQTMKQRSAQMAQGVPVVRLCHLDEVTHVDFEEVEETSTLVPIHLSFVRQCKRHVVHWRHRFVLQQMFGCVRARDVSHCFQDRAL